MIDLLLQFGRAECAGAGVKKVFADKACRRRIRTYAGAMWPALQDHLDLFVVVSEDDQIITVGHLTERVRRH